MCQPRSECLSNLVTRPPRWVDCVIIWVIMSAVDTRLRVSRVALKLLFVFDRVATTCVSNLKTVMVESFLSNI